MLSQRRRQMLFQDKKRAPPHGTQKHIPGMVHWLPGSQILRWHESGREVGLWPSDDQWNSVPHWRRHSEHLRPKISVHCWMPSRLSNWANIQKIGTDRFPSRNVRDQLVPCWFRKFDTVTCHRLAPRLINLYCWWYRTHINRLILGLCRCCCHSNSRCGCRSSWWYRCLWRWFMLTRKNIYTRNQIYFGSANMSLKLKRELKWSLLCSDHIYLTAIIFCWKIFLTASQQWSY